MISVTCVTQWRLETGSFYCNLKFIPGKRKFVSQGNSFDSLILLPFFIVLEIFNVNFLICRFILSKTLKILHTKFQESVANFTAKFILHTRINFLIQLDDLFFLYFHTLCIVLSGDIELNPWPKSSLSSGLSIRYWNLDCLAARNFSKVGPLQAYNSVNTLDIICSSETFLDLNIQW